MTQIVRISALLLSSALLMFAGGMHGLILPVRGASEGFALLSLGLIGTGWSIGYMSGSLVVPRLVSRIGHIRTYAVMGSIATITILLNLLIMHEWSWILLRILSGFCFAGAAMVVESWLNEVTDNESRGTTFSVYMSVTLFASTAGQMMISVTGVAGYIPFVLAAMAYASALLPTAVTAMKQPAPLKASRIDLKLLYKTSPIAVVSAFSIGIANGAFGTLAAVYGIQRNFSTSTVAYLISLAIVSGAIAQIPLGRLSDRIDRRFVLIGVALCGSVSGLMLFIINPNENVFLYLLFASYGLAAYSLYAIAVAHANDFARDGEFSKIASGMIFILGAGQMVGPILASISMGNLGPSGIFLVTATFHAILAGFAFYRMKVRKPVPVSDRAPFQPMNNDKSFTIETVALDPRSEGDDENQSPIVSSVDLDDAPEFGNLDAAIDDTFEQQEGDVSAHTPVQSSNELSDDPFVAEQEQVTTTPAEAAVPETEELPLTDKTDLIEAPKTVDSSQPEIPSDASTPATTEIGITKTAPTLTDEDDKKS